MANKKRLIDANVLIWKLKQHHDLFINEWEGFSNLPEKDKARVDEISMCIAELFNAPTVDAVEVVHGQWALYPDWRYLRCSNCKVEFEEAYFPKTKNYCPNCGAKMDGDGNET